MEIVIVSIAAFLVAILTFFSGFGLGTILTPIFMLFFPVEIAIGLTGIVHLFNNIFKLLLVGGKADRNALMRFGVPAVVAAFIGSWLLLNLTEMKPLFSYILFEKKIHIYPLKFIVAIVLILFALMDLIPFFQKLEFNKDKLPIGGALSGFFGGLSGNQGALRTAFLMKAGLSKEAFVATAVVVSTFVDLTRLGIYSTNFKISGLEENITLVVSATMSGILGSYIGNKILRKITLKSIHRTVAILLILISIALGSGLI